MSKLITQEAVVLSQTQNLVKLSMSCQSACAACHAKGVCTSMDQQEKEMTIACQHDEHYVVGEQVNIQMTRQMGLKAVLYGYLIPLLVFVFTLLISFQITNNEITSALISLSLLAVYYIFLYLMRTKLSNSFTFVLQKTKFNV